MPPKKKKEPDKELDKNGTVLNKKDLTKIENYEKYLEIYKINKISNNRITIDDNANISINRLVCRVNKIVIHSYHFLKYYCIYNFNEYDSLPIIDKDFIRSIMITVTDKGHETGRPASKETQKELVKLGSFYNSHYKYTMVEADKISREGLTNQLTYESEHIITCLTNHISNNFETMLNRYINILVNLDEYKKSFREQYEKLHSGKTISNRDILYSFKKLKRDIFKSHEKASPIYDNFKLIFKHKILKDFRVKGNLQKHLKEDPLSLLILMIRMSVEAEKICIDRQLPEDKGKIIKAINCFPLRKRITPKYIKIDTSTIIDVFLGEKDRMIYKYSQLENYREIWSKFFNIDNKIFRKNGYTWNRTILTDGVSSSVLFIRNDKYKHNKASKIKTMKKPFGYLEFKNISTLNPDEIKKIDPLSGKKYVGIDPGKGILIYCTDGKVKLIKKRSGKIHRKANVFKYTNAHRKFETKVKLNNKRLEMMKAGKGDIKSFALNDTIRYQERKLAKLNKVKRPDNISIKKYEDDKKNLAKLIEENKAKRAKRADYYKLYKSDLFLGETVKYYESMLSKTSSSSCLLSNVKYYIQMKNLINHVLFGFYERKIHRKSRWNQFINKQRADSKMIQRFKDKFGPPGKVVVFMGNWSEGKPMKYQEPSKGKSIRRLFRNHGYEVYLVTEYNTSQRMYQTGAQLVNFRKHEDKKKSRRQKIREKQKKKYNKNKNQDNKKQDNKQKNEKQNNKKQDKKEKTGYVHRIVGSEFLKSFDDRTTNGARSFIKYVFDGNTRAAIDIINRDLNGSLNILLRAMYTIMYGEEGIPWYLKYQPNKVKRQIKLEDLKEIEKVIFNKQVLDTVKEITAANSIVKNNKVVKESNKDIHKRKRKLMKVIPTDFYRKLKKNDKTETGNKTRAILNKIKMDRKTRGEVGVNRSTKVTKIEKSDFSYAISDSESTN